MFCYALKDYSVSIGGKVLNLIFNTEILFAFVLFSVNEFTSLPIVSDMVSASSCYVFRSVFQIIM